MVAGVTKRVRELVLQRDKHTCQWCGQPIRTDWYSLQHRRARGMGGSRRLETNQAVNLVTVCGSATTGCHGHIEAHPAEAAERGFRISQSGTPSRAPIRTASFGVVFLTVEGGFREV